MKKFLKVLLIIILVCSSVGITAFLFYQNLNKDEDYFSQLNTFASSEENDKFLLNLQAVGETADAARFELLYTTNTNLDDSMRALSSYLILEKEYDFKDKSIKNSYNSLKSAKNFAIRTMDEYFAKIEAGALDPARADGVYTAFAKYFVTYSKFLNKLNGEIKVFKINKTTDLKFSLIEIYSNICISTFSNLDKVGLTTQIVESENIKYINKVFKLNHSYVETNSGIGDFSYYNTEFITAYNNCKKESFAEELYSLVGQVDSSLKETYSTKQVAAYWFKKIFGV